MAIEDEDMRRRWEKRERLKKQRKKQQRRLIIGLIAAAVVLIAVGVLIFFMARDAQPGTPADPQPVRTTPAPTTAPGETMGPDTTVIHIAAAGDFNITDKTIASGGTLFSYTDAIMDVVPLLADADLTLMNFEGNLAGAPYGTETRSAPQSVADALDAAGVDFLQLANSWSLKNGIIGLNKTISNVRLAGMEPLGVYSTNSEARNAGGYTICTVKGVKIALVAFTKGMDSGKALPVGSEKCINVLYKDYDSTYNKVDYDGIQKILKDAKDEKPDLIVAMLHWGSEYNDTISDTQKKLRDYLFGQGVNVILGSHPHYVQSMVHDVGANTFIAYSLGDFFGEGSRNGTAYSVVLDLEITKDNRSGETRITGFDYTPIYSAEGSDGLLQVMRLEPAITAYENKYIDRVSESVYESMKYALERIDKRINAPVEDKK